MKQPTKEQLRKQILDQEETIRGLRKTIDDAYQWCDSVNSINWCWECSRKFDKANAAGDEE